jgi:uncharacterized protein DUF4411
VLVFDTSAFINGWRIHYRPTTFPTVWERVAEAMAAEFIIAPREVYNELQTKDDDVAHWAHARVHLFVEPSEAVQRAVGPIQASFKNPGVRDRADPFVVAEAPVRSFTVVTYEGTNSITGARTRRWEEKMPGICEELGIQCRIVPEALEMLGVTI